MFCSALRHALHVVVEETREDVLAQQRVDGQPGIRNRRIGRLGGRGRDHGKRKQDTFESTHPRLHSGHLQNGLWGADVG